VAWPVAARAQQQAVPVIGVLLPQSAGDYKIEIAAFLQTLKEAGFVAGQNVACRAEFIAPSAPPPCRTRAVRAGWLTSKTSMAASRRVRIRSLPSAAMAAAAGLMLRC
jgi:hypothetical protein